jgi:hypothetical protein
MKAAPMRGWSNYPPLRKARTKVPPIRAALAATGSALRILGHSRRRALNSRLMGTTLIRGAVVLFAVVVAAWLAVSYRDAELQQRGRAVELHAQEKSLSRAEVRRGRDLLHRSRRLRADITPLISEAGLLINVGRKKEAAAIARRITGMEPDNVDAWYVAYGTAPTPRKSRQALDQIRRLNPWAADALP